MADVLTLDQLKLFKGFEDEFAEDDRLQQVMDGVERAAVNYIGRRYLVHTALTGEIHSAKRPTRLIVLRHAPVKATSTNVLVNSNDLGVEGTDWLLEADSGVLRLPQGGLWAAGFYHINVDYTPGYEVDAATFATSHPDFIHALTVQVAYEFTWAGRKGRVGALSTVHQTGATESYITTDWAPGVLAVLDRFKRRRLL